MTSNFYSANLEEILIGMGMKFVNTYRSKEDLKANCDDFINIKSSSSIIIECDSCYSVNPMVMVGDNLSDPTKFS